LEEKAGGDENMSGVTELGELPRVFRGYAPEAVDELVSSAGAARARARREIQELREQARRLGEELDEVQQPERELREAFVTAQREADELRTRAVREASAIRDSARERANERMAWLADESTRIQAEIERMRRVEHEFHEAIRVILLDALRRLDENGREPAGQPRDAPVAETGASQAVAVAAPPEARSIVTPAAPASPPPAPSLDEDTIGMPAVSVAQPTVEWPDAVTEPVARPVASRSILYSIAILVAAAGIAVAIWQLQAGTPEPSGTVTTQIGTTTAAAVGSVAASATASAQADDGVQTAAATAAETAPETEAETGSEATAGTAAEPAAAGPTNVALRLRAAGGDCWLSVRAGSASGKLLFEGFLFRGESRRFEAKRVWIRVGNGGNLAARLNGERLEGLPAGTGDVLVTADGARTLTLG
jgi:cell division septum initiation protein DivIVA